VPRVIKRAKASQTVRTAARWHADIQSTRKQTVRCFNSEIVLRAVGLRVTSDYHASQGIAVDWRSHTAKGMVCSDRFCPVSPFHIHDRFAPQRHCSATATGRQNGSSVARLETKCRDWSVARARRPELDMSDLRDLALLRRTRPAYSCCSKITRTRRLPAVRWMARKAGTRVAQSKLGSRSARTDMARWVLSWP
jgi:hypothetical protein